MARRSGRLARSYNRRFYISLGLVFSIAIIAVAIFEVYRGGARPQSVDVAIKYRLSSPKPDPSIIILDIDERSLSELASEHGRWPWPRVVLAEALANLEGARAVLLNVMLSDPDKGNPDSDNTFNEVAAASRNVVFPLIRLNAANDSISEVRVGALPNAILSDLQAGDKRIAVLFPTFTGSHRELAVLNLTPDSDGIVRSFPARWPGDGYKLPSAPLRAVELARAGPVTNIPDSILLNWRNKRGDYRRVSFVDFLKGRVSGDSFKDAIVVVGVSAPGIAGTKPTPASAVADDNIILATAIDDIKNETYLRLTPDWVIAVTSLLVVALTMAAFTASIRPRLINKAFGATQAALVGVTVGTASYSFQFVDLRESLLAGIGYFVIAKIHAILAKKAARGVPLFIDYHRVNTSIGFLTLIGLDQQLLKPKAVRQCVGLLEKTHGLDHVIVIDNAFGVENVFGTICKDYLFVVVMHPGGAIVRDKQPATATIAELLQQATAREEGWVVVEREAAPGSHYDQDSLSAATASALIEAAGELLSRRAQPGT